MRKEKLMMIFLLLSMMLIVGCGAKKSNLSQVGISMEDVPVESVSVKEVPSIQPAIASVVPSPIPTPVPVIIPNEIVDKVFIPSPTSTPTPVPSPTSTPDSRVIVNNNVNVNMPITQNNNVLKENESSSPTPTATATPVPTPTATVTPVPTPTATATPVPTPTATVTPVPTPTATVTPVPTPTATATPFDINKYTKTNYNTKGKLLFNTRKELNSWYGYGVDDSSVDVIYSNQFAEYNFDSSFKGKLRVRAVLADGILDTQSFKVSILLNDKLIYDDNPDLPAGILNIPYDPNVYVLRKMTNFTTFEIPISTIDGINNIKIINNSKIDWFVIDWLELVN